jgi:recombination protein RecR
MISFPAVMERLIHEFSKLPSIGQKSATRLAYFLVTAKPELAESLSQALQAIAAKIVQCHKCFFLCEKKQGEEIAICSVCQDPKRDSSIICVVEKPMDVLAVERVSEFSGVYHVLHGLWSPLRGQGTEVLRIKELEDRVKEGGVSEVILATGSTLEGDATALYLSNLLSQYKIKVTRLAQGIPKGGELEYADEITLSRAFSGRSSLS